MAKNIAAYKTPETVLFLPPSLTRGGVAAEFAMQSAMARMAVISKVWENVLRTGSRS